MRLFCVCGSVCGSCVCAASTKGSHARPHVRVDAQVFFGRMDHTLTMTADAADAASWLAALAGWLTGWLSGHILLGGRPLKEYNPLWLREHLTVVSQNCHVIPGTVRDNLLLGAPLGALTPDAAVQEAMELAGCYGTVRRRASRVSIISFHAAAEAQFAAEWSGVAVEWRSSPVLSRRDVAVVVSSVVPIQFAGVTSSGHPLACWAV